MVILVIQICFLIYLIEQLLFSRTTFNAMFAWCFPSSTIQYILSSVCEIMVMTIMYCAYDYNVYT